MIIKNKNDTLKIRIKPGAKVVRLEDGRTVTPSAEVQTITPGAGFDGFKSVTIEPIPNNYGRVEWDGTRIFIK